MPKDETICDVIIIKVYHYLMSSPAKGEKAEKTEKAPKQPLDVRSLLIPITPKGQAGTQVHYVRRRPPLHKKSPAW
jgi:hypothetical protein